MRYSIIDLDSCEKHTFRDYMILNTTDNPIISCIAQGGTYRDVSSMTYLSNQNVMKPYYTSDNNKNGITIHPNGDGSYHIYGTCTSTYNNTYIYTKSNRFNTYSSVGLTIEVTDNIGANDPVFLIKNSPEVTIKSGTTQFNGDFTSFSIIYFKMVKGETYDFNVKIWSFLYESSDYSYHQYVDPIQIVGPTRYNGTGYNLIVPKKLLNTSVVITLNYDYPNSSYHGGELYYNPDYEFDYRTITEDMDRLNIPSYVRPFSGYITSSTSYVPLPEYPVKALRFMDSTSTTAYAGTISAGDFFYDRLSTLDSHLYHKGDSLYYLYPGSTYSASSYNIYRFNSAPSSSYTRLYEWVLGDPPLELATD